MSQSRIMPYPRVADANVRSDLGASVSFLYLSRGEQLEVEGMTPGHCRLTSPGWRPRLDPLTVKAEVSIARPDLLFSGNSSHSSCIVAGADASIGVVLKWMLPESKIRGVVIGQEVLTAASRSSLSVTIEKTFNAAIVRNRAEFSVELFLFRASGVANDVYARIVGSGLASIGGMILHTGGSGGMFPTSSRAVGPKSPLWELELNINDEEDLDRDFSGDVCMLYLNSDHRLYSEVVRADMSGAVSPLMFEIFSECCVMLLLRVMKTLDSGGCLDKLDEQPDSGDEGMSTLSAVQYMKQRLFPGSLTHELYIEEIENLSKLVRKSLEQKLKQTVIEASNVEVR